jgi:hypothetical protein
MPCSQLGPRPGSASAHVWRGSPAGEKAPEHTVALFGGRDRPSNLDLVRIDLNSNRVRLLWEPPDSRGGSPARRSHIYSGDLLIEAAARIIELRSEPAVGADRSALSLRRYSRQSTPAVSVGCSLDPTNPLDGSVVIRG